MMTTNASECEIIANLRAMFFCYSTSFITSSASSFGFATILLFINATAISFPFNRPQLLGKGWGCALAWHNLYPPDSVAVVAKSDPLPGLARTRSVAHYNRNEHNYRTTITATTWSTGKCSNYNPKCSGSQRSTPWIPPSISLSIVARW